MFLRGPLGCPFVGVPGRYLWGLFVVGWGMQVHPQYTPVGMLFLGVPVAA